MAIPPIANMKAKTLGALVFPSPIKPVGFEEWNCMPFNVEIVSRVLKKNHWGFLFAIMPGKVIGYAGQSRLNIAFPPIEAYSHIALNICWVVFDYIGLRVPNKGYGWSSHFGSVVKTRKPTARATHQHNTGSRRGCDLVNDTRED